MVRSRRRLAIAGLALGVALTPGVARPFAIAFCDATPPDQRRGRNGDGHPPDTAAGAGSLSQPRPWASKRSVDRLQVRHTNRLSDEPFSGSQGCGLPAAAFRLRPTAGKPGPCIL